MHSCLRHQEEVETALGLDKSAISVFYQGLGGRGSGATKGKRIQDHLEKAGVFRSQGATRPHRVWWLAFRGKDATRPRFEDRGENNLCVPAGSGAEEHRGTLRDTNPGVGATTAQEGGGSSTVTPDEQEEEELPEKTKRRYVLRSILLWCLCGVTSGRSSCSDGYKALLCRRDAHYNVLVTCVDVLLLTTPLRLPLYCRA